MTDQQRACTVLPGAEYKAKTPVLDGFREGATTFTRHYCPSPHCCPSRASFFTGLMPTQHGVWHNVNVANAISRGLKERIRPWSVDLKEAGYDLHFAGKWHVSNFQQPSDYGWRHIYPGSMCPGAGRSLDEQALDARDRELAFLRAHGGADETGRRREPGEILRPGLSRYVHYGTHDQPLLSRFFHQGEPDNPFADRTVTEAAIERLDLLEDEPPWCLYIGTLGPHDPYLPPREFLELYKDVRIELPETFEDAMEDKPALYRRTRDRFHQLTRDEHREAIRHYLAFCSYEDWLFGRVINRLKQQGRYDETLILYLSDHGDYLGDHGLWCKGLPSFLGAYHVPAIMKLPGQKRAEVNNDLVSLCDFGPTLLDVAGVASPTEFAGRSLLPLLSDRPAPPPDRPAPAWRDALFFQTNGNETYGIQRSVLTDRWRFVHNGFDYDELYDLENDPGQMRNLARNPEYGGVVREMYRRIWRFGLAHEEHLVNDYIMTAMADHGPATAWETNDDRGGARQKEPAATPEKTCQGGSNPGN